MDKARLILLSNHSVLAGGIWRWLEAADDWEVALVDAADPKAGELISQFSPRVIILDAGERSWEQRMVASLLDEHPRAIIVSLSLWRKYTEVYRKERVAVPSLPALLDAIESQAKRAAG